MFTGIITDLGTILSIEERGDRRVRIATRYDTSKIDMGASIASDGCCLTVVDKGTNDTGHWYDVDISAESLRMTNLGNWEIGSRVNLERSLRLGDEMGGHLVSGHVDGVAKITKMEAEGDSTKYVFQAPKHLAKFIAPKGSIALNGTSLTVNQVEDTEFSVNIIPHTKEVTTWGLSEIGHHVNLEIDTVARYVARLTEYQNG